MTSANAYHITARICAGKLHCSVLGIGPIFTKLNHLCALDYSKKFFSALQLDCGRAPEIGTQFHLIARSAYNRFYSMSYCYTAQATTIFNVFITIYVPYPTTLALHHIRCHSLRKLIIPFGICMGAPRYQIVKSLLQAYRFNEFHGESVEVVKFA